jgi:hypothetical protein
MNKSMNSPLRKFLFFGIISQVLNGGPGEKSVLKRNDRQSGGFTDVRAGICAARTADSVLRDTLLSLAISLPLILSVLIS